MPMNLRAFSLGAAAVVLGLAPTPVGRGPRYQPPARSQFSRFACHAAPLSAGPRIHVELFARRRVVIVPAAIGLERARLRLGRVVRAGCRARAWTLDPSGIVDYEGRTTLGHLFRVWGQPLGLRRLASFRGAVSVYVDGIRRRGDPRTLRLRRGAESRARDRWLHPAAPQLPLPTSLTAAASQPPRTVRRTSIAMTAAATPQARAASDARSTSGAEGVRVTSRGG